MKKIYIGLTLCATAMLIPGLSARAQTDISNETKLGKTINAVEAESYGDISKYSVLSPDYYSKLEYISNYDKAASETNAINATSNTEIKRLFQRNYTIEAKADNIPIKLFTCSAREKFNLEASYLESNYVSTNYYEIYGKKAYCEYYIEDISYKYNQFKSNLSESFIRALDLFASDELSYEEFFKKYGTHLIGGYTVGNKVEIEAVISTNSTIIENEISTNIEADLKGEFGKSSAEATSNRSFYSKYNLEEKNTYMSLKAISDSCILPAVSSIENISQAYEYWNNNTNISTGTIVEYDDDSLVPIWDLLPDDSPVSSIEMKTKFIEYAEGKEYIITSSSEGHIFEDLTSSYTRSNSKTITDCDRFSNYIDSFSLDTIYGVEVLKKKYDYLKFDISFKAEKKKFGDRYVYLYYGEDAYVGSDMHKYSLASGSISCPISGIFYSRSKTFTVKCENLKSKNFALVWRATGYKSDKWYCKDVNVKITAYKK